MDIIYRGDDKSRRMREKVSRLKESKEFEIILGNYDTMDIPERVSQKERASLGHMNSGREQNQHPLAEVYTIFLQNRPSREM